MTNNTRIVKPTVFDCNNKKFKKNLGKREFHYLEVERATARLDSRAKYIQQKLDNDLARKRLVFGSAHNLDQKNLKIVTLNFWLELA